MNFKLTIFLLLLSFSFGKAQNYIQIGVNAKGQDIKVISLGKSGLMVLEKIIDEKLIIKKIDFSLAFEWEIEVPIDYKSQYVTDFYDGSFAYIVLNNPKENIYEVFQISVNFAVVNRKSIKVLPGFELNHFKANEKIICMAGNIKKEPLLVLLKAENTVPKLLSLNGTDSRGIQSLSILDNDIISISMIRSDSKKSELLFRNYDIEGNVISSEFISAKQDLEFLSSTVFQLGNKELIIGNYGRLIFYKEDIQNSAGVFVIDLGQNSKVNYYGFDEFTNAFNFLSPKEKERLNKEIQKRKEKGKAFRSTYRVNINTVKSSENGLLISAEMFQPIFRSSNNTSLLPLNTYIPYGLGSRYFYNPYNLMTLNPSFNRQAKYFEGYRYYSGMVMALDSSGKLVWDNSFAYKNIFTSEQKSHIKLDVNKTGHFVSYGTGTKFEVNAFDDTGKLQKSESFGKANKDFLSTINKNEFDNFEYWHDNFFISWSILPRVSKTQDFKNICFVQKISIN